MNSRPTSTRVCELYGGKDGEGEEGILLVPPAIAILTILNGERCVRAIFTLRDGS